MNDTVTWILTADDWNAQIHDNRDGASVLVHSFRNRLPEPFLAPSADVEAADFAAFRDAAELDDAQPRATHLCFSHELLWFLSEATFDELIIMATPQMLQALDAIKAPGVRERVIARIVMTVPIGIAPARTDAEIPRDGRGALRAADFEFAVD